MTNDGEAMDATVEQADEASEGTTADRASLRQSTTREVRAHEVQMIQAAAGAVTSDVVSITQSAVGVVRGQDVSLSMGGAALIVGDRIRIAQGGAQAILAGESVTIEQGGAAAVLARNVQVGPNTLTGFLIARTVNGDVRTLFDWRGALAFGAAFGVLSGLIGAVRHRD